VQRGPAVNLASRTGLSDATFLRAQPRFLSERSFRSRNDRALDSGRLVVPEKTDVSLGRRDYSREDMGYAVRLANRGYSEPMIFRALAAKPSGKREPGSIKYQRILDERGRDAADAYARRTAGKAVEWVKRNPPIRDRPEALVRLTEIATIVSALPWAIYAGPAARRALEAVFVVAKRVGGVRFGLSLREWAELAGMTKRGIESHRDTLLRMGWLRRDPTDRLGRTSRFTLAAPRDIQLTGGGSECPPFGDATWLDHDAFREGALGDLGWYVFASLAIPMTLAELGIRTGLGLEGAEDMVALLDRAELVVFQDNEIVARADCLIDRLGETAELFDTSGRGEAERELHRQQRDAFRRREDVNVREPVA
jgi:hypothetical protein